MPAWLARAHDLPDLPVQGRNLALNRAERFKKCRNTSIKKVVMGAARPCRLVEPLGAQPRGSKLDGHRDYILAMVAVTPDITISEMLERLATECGVQAGRATLWTFLDRCGLSFKKNRHTRPSRIVRIS